MMKAYAHYNYGRWVVDCPRKGCAAATQVWPGGKLYRCPCTDVTVCTHDGVCNQRVTPVVPADYREILQALAKRPASENRNWLPGETVEMLHAENIEHGTAV